MMIILTDVDDADNGDHFDYHDHDKINKQINDNKSTWNAHLSFDRDDRFYHFF